MPIRRLKPAPQSAAGYAAKCYLTILVLRTFFAGILT